VKGERIMATETTGQLFPLGQVVATPGALEALEEAGVAVGTLLARHAAGEWGDLDREDRGLNEQALVSGARILSVYRLSAEVTMRRGTATPQLCCSPPSTRGAGSRPHRWPVTRGKRVGHGAALFLPLAPDER